MFKKILIANRGEIACRILRTARRMGLRTVAVYSEADAHAHHVRLADEAFCIGEADARASYLAIPRILEACRASGAQAVHPGYGFLSENADFAQACLDAGLVFIGPPPSAIRAMGSKSAAREKMQQAGIPITPGYHGERQEPDFLKAQADAIGYPVLLKPVAGGGGKGMRIVQAVQTRKDHDPQADFETQLAACQREALSAFGDSRVLIEKYLPCARHIEIQIFTDTQGNVLHLFERDCSLQRRHQKVMEEAPAPGMTAERRAAMAEAALLATKSVGYVGAGTVEFIVDAQTEDGPFYFMEMNTRLQVEHPVTECVTGLDLVEWQLRVAAGEALPMRQEDLTLKGHAIEVRLYAEDPSRNFLPSPGKLLHLAWPENLPGLRIDTGVESGDTITPFYDPMIAKLIVCADHRDEALDRLQQALSRLEIIGIRHNAAFLSHLVNLPAVRRGALDTRLIERERAEREKKGFNDQGTPPSEIWLIAALAEILKKNDTHHSSPPRPSDPWEETDGWRLLKDAPRCFLFRWKADHDEEQKTLEHTLRLDRSPGTIRIEFDGSFYLARPIRVSDHHLCLELDGRRLQALVMPEADRRHILLHPPTGPVWTLNLIDPLQGYVLKTDAGSESEYRLTAPLPGRIVSLLVQPGERVLRGTPLLILEAMKMETTIRAPADGLVQHFPYPPGTLVSEAVELVSFLPNEVAR